MKYNIGTICNLKNSDVKILIIGYDGKSIKSPNYVFNYIGVVFPEGFIDNNKLCYFNNEHIGEIISLGYSDDNKENNISNELVKEEPNVQSTDNNASTEEEEFVFDENGILIEVISKQSSSEPEPKEEIEKANKTVSKPQNVTLTSIDISNL